MSESDGQRGGRPPFPSWRKWVILLLAIGLVPLLGLAFGPGFLGARSYAWDPAAQSGLRNALAAANTPAQVPSHARNALAAAEATPTGLADYSEVTSETLSSVEPSLTYVTTDSTGPKVISWDVRTTTTTDDTIDLAALSKSGACYYLEEITASGLTYGWSESGQDSCAGIDAAGADGGWVIYSAIKLERKLSALRWLCAAILVAIAALVLAPRRAPRSGSPVA